MVCFYVMFDVFLGIYECSISCAGDFSICNLG